MGKRRRSEKKESRDTTTHLFARTVERNTRPRKRMNVGNSKRTKTLILPTGNQRRAPEGARGP